MAINTARSRRRRSGFGRVSASCFAVPESAANMLLSRSKHNANSGTRMAAFYSTVASVRLTVWREASAVTAAINAMSPSTAR